MAEENERTKRETLAREVVAVFEASSGLLRRVEAARDGIVGSAVFEEGSDTPLNWQGQCLANLDTLVDDELRPACLRLTEVLEILIQ